MAFQLNPQMIQEALTKATKELPPLPNVIVRVLQLTGDSDSSSISEIEQIIRSDQAISSKLLRVVNSAYFGLSGQVSSISQAVVILGYTQVRNLVLSVSMMSQFQAIGPKAKDAQQRLWELAFGTASGSQLLAKKMRLEPQDLELTFVAGLLQNVGSLFMLNTLQRSYLSVIEEAENSKAWLADVETLRLGVNHASVGQQLLCKWKLPDPLIFIVGGHEGPFNDQPSPALYCVHAAKKIAYAAMNNIEAEENFGIAPEVAAWLNFSPSDYEWAVSEVKEKIQLAVDLLASMGQ